MQKLLKNNWLIIGICVLTALLIIAIIIGIDQIITIVVVLEAAAVAIYAVYAYRLWEATKINADITKEQTNLLTNQLNLQYKPTVAVNDINGEVYVDSKKQCFLILDATLLNYGNSIAEITDCKMQALLTDYHTMQTIRSLIPIEEISGGFYKSAILPQTNQSVRMIFRIEKEEKQKIENSEIIIEPIVHVYFNWLELNKKYEVKQIFSLVRTDTFTFPRIGRIFRVDGKSCDIRELT